MPCPSHNDARIQTIPPQCPDFLFSRSVPITRYSKYFTKLGEYKIAIQPKEGSSLEVLHFEPLYNGHVILKEFYQTIEKKRIFSINRTAQIVKGSKIEIKLHLKGAQAGGKLVISPPHY